MNLKNLIYKRKKIENLNWYWKLLFTIPVVFLGLLLVSIVNFLLGWDGGFSFCESFQSKLKSNFFPFLIILVLFNASSLFYKRKSKVGD